MTERQSHHPIVIAFKELQPYHRRLNDKTAEAHHGQPEAASQIRKQTTRTRAADVNALLLPRSNGQSILIGLPPAPTRFLNTNHHSYPNQPSQTIVYQPIVFDLSSLFRTNHHYPSPTTTTTAVTTSSATTTAATTTDAASAFGPHFAAYRIPTLPPVQAKDQNLAKYSHYLEILHNIYGIQLPGELGQAVPAQPEYLPSAYPTTIVTSYEPSSSYYVSGASEGTLKGVDDNVSDHKPSSTVTTLKSQPQHQASPQASSMFAIPQEIVHEKTVEELVPNLLPSDLDVYSQAIYPEPQILQHQQLVPPQTQNPSMFSIIPVTLSSSNSEEAVVYPFQSVQPQAQHSQQSIQDPVQQVPAERAIHQPTQSQGQPQLSVTAGTTIIQQVVPLSYKTAALLANQAQSNRPKPQAEDEHEKLFTLYTTPSYWLSNTMTKTTTQQPTTTRTRQPSTSTTNTRTPITVKSQETVVSAQSLIQRIRRLPAVLYVDSKANGSQELESLLRDTYGLPLVAFYVDKLEQPQLVQKLLHKLTAHKTLPYLFICGTFIGSDEHIRSYHENRQIPQLIEYVCGEDHHHLKKKKKSSGARKTSA